jgi:hypothetical protein
MNPPMTCRGLKKMSQKNNESALRTDACCRPTTVTAQARANLDTARKMAIDKATVA